MVSYQSGLDRTCRRLDIRRSHGVEDLVLNRTSVYSMPQNVKRGTHREQPVISRENLFLQIARNEIKKIFKAQKHHSKTYFVIVIVVWVTTWL